MKNFELSDGLVVAGLVALSVGLWLYDPRMACVVTGSLLVIIGLRMQG